MQAAKRSFVHVKKSFCENCKRNLSWCRAGDTRDRYVNQEADGMYGVGGILRLVAWAAAGLLLVSASEFPERECCDLDYPGQSTEDPMDVSATTLAGNVALKILLRFLILGLKNRPKKLIRVFSLIIRLLYLLKHSENKSVLLWLAIFQLKGGALSI